MSVLFICSGNAARSQMAEAFYNRQSSDDIATSAGTEVIVGKPMPDDVIAVMKEVNIDVSNAQRKQVTQDMVDRAEHIVLMTHNSLPDYLADNSKVVFWDIGDPRGLGREAHQTVRNEIQQKVDQLLAEQYAREN